MNQKRFNFINNILGWVVFGVAAFTYLSTIEPTVSLWDCGEFIAGSYKLEVVHPPGAPFFLMLHRLISMLAPEPRLVPVFINGASGIWSAGAVLFLFWSISLLARKIFIKDEQQINFWQAIAIWGAAATGALAFTFSDTFWFSAVEGEVYALSAFFLSLVFWLLFKWERRAEQPDNLKWIILIFYLMGLSIGVHLLSLLVSPVLAFVYYFRKKDKVDLKGVFISFTAGMLILGFIMVVIIKWIPAIAGKFEILFVNNLGLPYWSGVIFTLLLLFGGLAYGIYRTHIQNKVLWNVIFISIFMVSTGYASYTMVAIRSNADPPIDYSNPDNIFNMIGYINREQYGERPILYGPQFTSEMSGMKNGRKLYIKKNGKYKFIGYKLKPDYDASQKMFFPRMSDTRADRADAYRTWSGMRKNQKKPTFAQNLRFFIRYQLGHMYWRYFAWNFIGRQNDEQGHGKAVEGGFLHGNWLSGIKFIDEMRLGSQDNLPYEQRINKAYNRMYFLPFLLGLIGMFFHFRKDSKNAISVLAFFLITGVLLVVYQNSPPFEPRERDYTLVGSFMAYSIWIGFGVLGIIHFLMEKIKAKPQIATVIAILVGIGAGPVLMASQEWDDHSRAHRFTSRDFGVNYLESCAPNAILFTNGDNDTYPLWYAQEVEGIRTDIRVVNLQLLMTDWYVEQLKGKRNDSEPFKFSFKQEQIVEGVRDYVVYYNNPALRIDPKRYYNINEILRFIASDNDQTKVSTYSGTKLDYYPTPRIYIPVDKEAVIKNKVVREELYPRIVDSIKFSIGRRNILKNSLMVLDLIANNKDWSRPVYFAITSGSDTYLGLQNYFQQEGMAYRLVPVKATKEERNNNPAAEGRVDTKIMFDNVMNKFQWGNLTDPRVYIGSVTRRHCYSYRAVFTTLAEALVREGDNEKAIQVLDKCLEVLPENQVPYNINTVQLAELYFLAGATDKGEKLSRRLLEIFTENLDYYLNLKPVFKKSADTEIRRNFYGLQIIQSYGERFNIPELAQDAKKELERLEPKYGI